MKSNESEKTAKKTTRRKKSSVGNIPEKMLPTGLNKNTEIKLSASDAAIVLTEDGRCNVYLSNESDTGKDAYEPHEELCIAIAALLQNPMYVKLTLTKFRELLDIAMNQMEKPENSID